MRVVCLCPTYKRPKSTMMSAWFFLQQTVQDTYLYIVDDGGSFTSEFKTDNIYLECVEKRFPTLPNKYNYMIQRAKELFHPDVFFVWENDDWYFPWHIESYLKAYYTYRAEFVHSDYVFHANRFGIGKRYTGKTHFHGSLSYLASITTMPFYEETHKMEFDLMLISKLNSNYRRYSPIHTTPSYCWFYSNPEFPSGSLLPNKNRPNDNWYIVAGKFGTVTDKYEFKPQLYDEYVKIINSLIPGSIDVNNSKWNVGKLLTGLSSIREK